MSTLLRGVTLPDGTRTDLAIVDGAIAAEAPSGAEVVDAEGLVALPGLVDVHVHLREPGREDTETVRARIGSRRAGRVHRRLRHGQHPAGDRHGGEGRAHPRPGRAGRAGRRRGDRRRHQGVESGRWAELGLMNRSRARSTMFSDDGVCVMNPQLMRRALEWVKPFGGVIAQHSQDAYLAGPGACCHEGELSGRLALGGWPAVAGLRSSRATCSWPRPRSRLRVCHISTAEGVEVVRWAKRRRDRRDRRGHPHHLLLGTENLTGYDTVYKVNPPLRTSEHIEAVREALADGTIDVVATDHAPHATQDKDHAFVDARPGMLGLEQALAVVHADDGEPGSAGLGRRRPSG